MKYRFCVLTFIYKSVVQYGVEYVNVYVTVILSQLNHEHDNGNE